MYYEVKETVFSFCFALDIEIDYLQWNMFYKLVPQILVQKITYLIGKFYLSM